MSATATRKTFVTNCVSAKGDDIQEMVDQARDITYQTFVRNVDPESLQKVKNAIGYTRELQKNCGITLENDYGVSFHKSKYRGRPCYYFCWSAIEHVFA